MPVFEEYLKRLRWTPHAVSDLVPWRMLAAPGVVLLKDQHALMRTYAVRGRDVMGEEPETIGARMLQANNVIKRLGGRWMLQSEAQRSRFAAYPHARWTHPIAAAIDADREQALLVTPGARETRYYQTLTWHPPAPMVQQGRRLLLHGVPASGSPEHDAAARLELFFVYTDYFMDMLRGMLAQCTPCPTPELLTYLHTCVSDRWHPVGRPASVVDLDAQLCDSAYVGGWYPQLGQWHLRICSIRAYPALSMAGLMQALEAKDLDFRLSTRWLGLEKNVQAGILRKTQGQWVQHERGIGARLSENLTGEPTRVINSDATRKAEEADAARQELGADIIAYGDFTTTVTVWDPDPQEADRKIREVMQEFDQRGFTTTPETTQATAAWLSSLPGNRLDNIRRRHHHSLTLAHLCPGLSAAWMGPERDTFLNGPPWFWAHTETSTAFRVVNHVRDIGHHMLLGPTGSGKSTLLGFGVAQWFKHEYARDLAGPQAVLFDVDKTARLLTLLLGGQWLDVGSGTVQLQPLRHIDDPQERGWAHQWVLNIVESAGVPLTGIVQEYLEQRLLDVAQLPPPQRTLHALLQCCEAHTRRVETRVSAGTRDASGLAHPDPYLRERVERQRDVQRAIRPLTREGEYGFILDGDHDDLATTHLYTFEQSALLAYGRLVSPVIQYLFHFAERRFSTERPMLLALEEAALVATKPLYKDKFDEWLMTTRKKGVSLAFVINSLQQTATMGMGLLTTENCPTRFYLPNSEATTPHTAAIYAQFGLTPAEMSLISKAMPYRDVYYSCRELGRRLFHLRLSPFILDCLARNTAQDHLLIDALWEQEGPEGFAQAWLMHHGYSEEAKACSTGGSRSCLASLP